MTEKQLFQPAHTGRAVEDIVIQIQTAILNHDIATGESLPSERELQHVFSTSRGVVREALQILRQKGLIEIRKGAHGGSYVKAIEVASVSESLTLFLRQNQVDSGHIIAYREAMDREIAPLAIIHGAPEDKEQLRQMAEQLVAAAEQEQSTAAQLGELDRALNIHFAMLTCNPVFEWMIRAMQSGFSSQDYALYSHADFCLATARNWLATADAICANQLSQCLGHIGSHYILLRRCVAGSDTSSHVSPWLRSSRT